MPGHGESAPLPETARLPEFVALAGAGAGRPWPRPGEPCRLSWRRADRRRHGGRASRPAGPGRTGLRRTPPHPEAAAAVAARAEALRRGDRDSSGPLARWFSAATAARPPMDWCSTGSTPWTARATPPPIPPSRPATACTPMSGLGVAQPALFLTGALDANSTPAMARDMAAAAPRGEAVVIEGHGHMVPTTAPDAVTLRPLFQVLQRGTSMTAPLDPRALRTAFGAFLTGVTVVTATDAAGRPLGFTANSFTSVSPDPALLLVCLAKRSPNFASADRRGGLRGQHPGRGSGNGLGNTFAWPSEDRFATAGWQTAGGRAGPGRRGGLARLRDARDRRCRRPCHPDRRDPRLP